MISFVLELVSVILAALLFLAGRRSWVLPLKAFFCTAALALIIDLVLKGMENGATVLSGILLAATVALLIGSRTKLIAADLLVCVLCAAGFLLQFFQVQR